MSQQRCSNCNQPIMTQRNLDVPCGYCGYLEGMEELTEFPEGDQRPITVPQIGVVDGGW